MTDFNTAQAIYNDGSFTMDADTGRWDIDYIEQNSLGNCTVPISDYYNKYWYPYVYPSITYLPEKSKIEQSFKIVNILFRKNLVNLTKVKDFVDLVSEIAKII